MNTVENQENLFLIDLRTQRVFCRACRKICRSLVLSESILFWCATRGCMNSGEVKLFRDGTWCAFGFEERWHDGLISEITLKLLHRIETGRKVELTRLRR